MPNVTHPATQRTAVEASARTRRCRQIARLIDTAPPMTDEQVTDLLERLQDHARVVPCHDQAHTR